MKLYLLFLVFSFVFTGVAYAAPPSGSPGGGGSCPEGQVKPKNNLIVTQDTVFCAGTYNKLDNDGDGIIIVGADNITLDGNNLTLDGKHKKGYGIVLNGYSGVTIKNFNIKNYYYAMRMEDASALTISNNNVSGNKVSDDTFLDINTDISNTPGGGILFNNVSGSNVSSNIGNNQDVGVNLYNSNTNIISNNNFSNNNAWGVRLYASLDNTISSNQLHNVNRCSNSGCDSAGVLLVYGSHNNSILSNNLTYSGDGFFIGNEHGLPSNNNLIEGNDGSFSPNNCFEATFSEGNIFRSNVANNCNYGFWLGFSHHSQLLNNTINNNRTDGVYWESGRFGLIEGNTFINNSRFGFGTGLSTNTTLIQKYPGSEASHNYEIRNNKIYDGQTHGIRLADTSASIITENDIAGNGNNIFLEGNSTDVTVNQNNIVCESQNKICTYNFVNYMPEGNDVDATSNWWGSADESAIVDKFYDNTRDSSKGIIHYDPWLTAPLDL